MSSQLLRDELPVFLRENNCLFDYVFLTGDIRTANVSPNCFTDEMSRFIVSLCETVGVGLDRLFIVPGNHDVDRNAPGRDDAIKRIHYGRQGYYDSDKGKIEPDDMAGVMTGEKDFVNFLSSIYDADRAGLYANPDSPHFSVETEHFNILHLDTTLTYTAGQEASNLIVGTKAVYETLRGLDPRKPTILLTHYPFMSLAEDERKQVSILLQKRGVRLWLAGHEHDQNLQRIKYLDSLQAGELRREAGCLPSFLIGEYDPDTYRCEVSAYTWYKEGWAKYPFVDLDGERKDIYECMLRPVAPDEVPALTRKARALNEQYLSRLPEKVETTLFPRLVASGADTDLGHLISDCWQARDRHALILAEGGMGKTTMLLSHCATSASPTVYIPAERLASMGIGIERYCADGLFGCDAEAFRTAVAGRYAVPSLTIVLDGLNEVDGPTQQAFVNGLGRIAMYGGVQIVVSSRTDLTERWSMPGFCQASLRELDDENIRTFFSDSEWNEIVGNPVLHRLLRNPMMVTIYREICSVIDRCRDVEFLSWRLPIRNETDMFHNYYEAQTALMTLRHSADGKMILSAMACVRDILPRIAYAYEETFSLSKENADFRKMLGDILDVYTPDEEAYEPVRDCYREYGHADMNKGPVADMIISDLHLMHRDRHSTSFPHQMYRDFLSARHIVSASANPASVDRIWNTRIIPYPVMVHVRNIAGKYWPGTAEAVRKAGEGRDDASILIRNLFDCFPSDSEGGVADYSGLHISGQALPSNEVYPLRISMLGAEIDGKSLGLASGNPAVYSCLSLSPDGEWLAASEGGNIHIFPLRRHGEPFVYGIRKQAVCMMFVGERLLVNAGCLILFSHESGEWAFRAEIRADGGSFTRKLKAAFLKDTAVVLYYNNRCETYSAVDGTRISIVNGPALWESHTGGTDIHALGHPGKQCLPEPDAVASAAMGDLRATSFRDGRIEVRSDGQLVCQPARGSAILLDAAISADGRRAVTLSHAVFDGRRRIQVWDLDRRVRTDKLWCAKWVRRISLSETGRWLIGETVTSSWVYDFETGIERLYPEKFVSNRAGRLVTYGNSVLRRQGNSLELFNLLTGEGVAHPCPVANPGLVCFMNDGSVGAVGKRGQTFRFRSQKDGSAIEIDGGGPAIVSVQPFKNKPFVAVSTADGLLSIYHTGNGARVRKLEAERRGVCPTVTVVHPSLTVAARTDGRRYLEINNFWEYEKDGQLRGRWYTNVFDGHPGIKSNILDLAFNHANGLLTVVLANGEIRFHHEKYCDFKSSFRVITAFDVDAYDFHGVVCSPEIEEILRRNGAEI